MSVIDGDEMSFRYTSINHNCQKDDVNDRPFKVLISLTRAKRVYSGLYIFTLIARLYILKKKNNLLNLTVNSFSRSIPTRLHRFDFAFMLYKLFATNLTGVSPACARALARFSACSTGHVELFECITVLSSQKEQWQLWWMDLGVRCDSANLRPLSFSPSWICRRKIERKFLVPRSEEGAKNPLFDATLRNVILCAKPVFPRY